SMISPPSVRTGGNGTERGGTGGGGAVARAGFLVSAMQHLRSLLGDARLELESHLPRQDRFATQATKIAQRQRRLLGRVQIEEMIGDDAAREQRTQAPIDAVALQEAAAPVVNDARPQSA